MAKAQQSGTQRKAPPAIVARAVPGDPFGEHAGKERGERGGASRSTRARATTAAEIDARLEEARVLVARGWTQTSACEHVGICADTVIDRRARDADFRARWEAAKDAQAEYWRDRIIEVADTEEDPARARLKQDALKWVLSKTRPREYGDKAVVEHSGPDGAAIAHRVEVALVPAAAGVVVDVPAQLARSGGDHDGDKAA